jgi:hypothetical protein
MADDDTPQLPWLAAAQELQEAGEQAVDQQTELVKRALGAASPASGGLSSPAALATGTASFKARVQSGGRISIPEPERAALDIEEGDIVQTVVVPITSDTNEQE